MSKPLNKTWWFVGADDGSTGYNVVLEWTDGTFHDLFRIEPGGDATAIGMMCAHLDAWIPTRLTEKDPRA